MGRKSPRGSSGAGAHGRRALSSAGPGSGRKPSRSVQVYPRLEYHVTDSCSHPPGPQGAHRAAHTHAGGEGTLTAAAAALHLLHTPLHVCHVARLTCWTIPIPSFRSAPPQPPPPTLAGTTLHALLQGRARGLSSRPGCKPLEQWARPSEPSQSSLSCGHAHQHRPNPRPRLHCSGSTRSQTLAQLPHSTGQALGQGHLQVSTQGGPPARVTSNRSGSGKEGVGAKALPPEGTWLFSRRTGAHGGGRGYSDAPARAPHSHTTAGSRGQGLAVRPRASSSLLCSEEGSSHGGP